MKDKLKLLFLPYIISLSALVVGYTFLHWLFYLKFSIFPVKDFFYLFIFPFILSGLLWFFYLKPKIKILKLEKKYTVSKWKDFYDFVLYILLVVPVIIAQHYMVTATGQLTELSSPKEINNYKSTKYYLIQNYYIDKKDYGFSNDFKHIQKSRHSFEYNLRMNLYFALPIFESEKDRLITNPLGWLCFKYSDKISDNRSEKEKEDYYQALVEIALDEIEDTNVYRYYYWDRIGFSDDYEGFQKAVKSHPHHSKMNNIIFVGIDTPFHERNGTKSDWLIATIFGGMVIWLIMIAIPEINKKELKRIQAGKPDEEAIETKKFFLSFAVPHKLFRVTPVIAYLNIGLFLIMAFSGLGFDIFKSKDLLAWGGNYAPLVKDGQWWRLLTSTFIHGSFLHLINNMYGLILIGIFSEGKIGSKKFALIYLLSGIAASLTSNWWDGSRVSVGASGAIFGMFGTFIALLLTKKYDMLVSKPFLVYASIFVLFSILMGMLGNIDNAAHIGGLICGFICGLYLYPWMKNEKG